MKYPTPRYSFLAFQFVSLLDAGVSIPIDETHNRIDDGTLLDWLEDQYKPDPYYFDLSLYGADERGLILKVFAELSNTVDASRKLGVRNNGIALCAAYCIEVMQHPDTYPDERFAE